MDQILVETQELSVGYQGKALISQIEFCLKKGEILSLIGPNGAGKSTILKSITKQLKCIKGVVTLNQKSLKDISEKELAKKMSIVFTERIRPELMTVWDVVAMGRYPYTGGLGILSEEDKTVVRETMELIAISGLENQQFSKLSDGQKQRVMLAKALCQEPEVLVLDEPTSYLDVKYKLEFLQILQKMTRQKKIGVIMSLHEIDLAERVSDQILCVKGKEIAGFGTPEQIFKDGFITRLYEIESGSFTEQTGCLELKKSEGLAKTFVIPDEKNCMFLFRKLQRKGTPFMVGILSENEMVYSSAKALSNGVIAEKPYLEFSEDTYQSAKVRMLECETVICCQTVFGWQNQKNKQLLEDAKTAGKNIEYFSI